MSFSVRLEEAYKCEGGPVAAGLVEAIRSKKVGG